MLGKAQIDFITIRLILSFVVVMVILLGVISYSIIAISHVDSLYRYKIDYPMARTERLLEFHQEFTEIRRLFKSSFYNPAWMETADNYSRIRYEQAISNSYLRMRTYANLYIALVVVDPHLYGSDRLDKEQTMQEILDSVYNVYRIFRYSFFDDDYARYYITDVLYYTGNVETRLQALRDFNDRIVTDILLKIESDLDNANTIAIAVSLFTIIIAFFIVFLMVKSAIKSYAQGAGRMHLMFDHAPYMIMYWNREHQLIDCNQVALSFYDLETKDELATNFSGKSEFWHKELETVFEKGRVLFEYETKKHGEILFFEVMGLRLEYMGDTVVVTYAKNITVDKKLQQEQERFAEAEASSQAKSRFLARMSHEIRTPLTAIQGIAHIQAHNPSSTEEANDEFSKIYDASNILVALIDDVLDISKIEADKTQVITDEYDVAGLIGDIINIQSASFGSKQIQFIVKVSEKIPRRLVGDVKRIRQVVMNVLSNAFKYTEQGEVSLVIGIGKVQNGTMNLCIEVADTGKGMSREQLDALHNDYTRFHETDAPFIQGTGLGMAIVYSLVGLMNAKLSIESTVGKGTKIIIDIPQEIAGSELIGSEFARSLEKFEYKPSRQVEEYALLSPGSVLVVDDIELNLHVARGFLARYDLNVDVVSNGQDAINFVNSGKVYDIIFMDHHMPGIDGNETTKILRDQGYDKPIVMLTANALTGLAEEYLNNGFDDYLTKPIRTDELDKLLRKHIKVVDSSKLRTSSAAFASTSSTPVVEEKHLDNRDDIRELIRQDISENHRDIIKEIQEAMRFGNKSDAGLNLEKLEESAHFMKEAHLAQLAKAALSAIMTGKEYDQALTSLEEEFNKLLKDIDALTQK